MNTANALNTYKNVGIESGIATADPHKLILMLYQGAMLAIASGKNQMLRKQIAAKGASISKAIKIIDEGLKACLDVKAGGEIGQNLFDLYDYMNQRLLIANLKNDAAILDEVSGLLRELKDAWESISPTAPPQQSETLMQAVQANNKAKIPAEAKSTIGKQAVSLYGRM